MLFFLVSGYGLLVSFPNPAFADRSCSQDTLCIESVGGWNSVELWAENLKPYEVTVTLSCTLENMEPQHQKLPSIFSVPGNSRIKALSLRTKNKILPWSYHYDFKWVRGKLQAKPDNYVYRLPFVEGKSFAVGQGFHGKFSHFGEDEFAVDFNLPLKSEVFAAREGRVVDIQESFERGGPDPAFKPFGNYIIIEHSDGTYGEYFHLAKEGALVEIGQKIERGKRIGLSGNTGYASHPHLHFGIYGAVNGETRRSFPIQFQIQEGPVTPVQGRSYTAVS